MLAGWFEVFIQRLTLPDLTEDNLRSRHFPCRRSHSHLLENDGSVTHTSLEFQPECCLSLPVAEL